MLKALGHNQLATPVKTDNATAASFVTDMLKQKRSKVWDVRYHWLSKHQALKTFFLFIGSKEVKILQITIKSIALLHIIKK